MPFVKQIVNYLNQQYRDVTFTGEKFKPSQFAGIAITMPDGEGKGGTHPILTEGYDNNINLSYDDIYSLQVYHKLTGVSHSKYSKQYGNNNNLVNSVYQMQIVIAGLRNKLLITPEELESLFLGGMVSVIPNTVTAPLKINQVLVMPVSSDMVSLNVWRDEYSREYALPPNQIMFRMNYSIQMLYDKSCIENCC